jgi:hypothetical protein
MESPAVFFAWVADIMEIISNIIRAEVGWNCVTDVVFRMLDRAIDCWEGGFVRGH